MRFADPTSLRGAYQYIFPIDPAFDYEREADEDTGSPSFADAYARWMDTGDYSVLEPFVKPEHTPAIFTLNPLTARQKRYVADLVDSRGNTQAAYEAVRLALVGISIPGEDLPPVERERGPQGWRLVTDEYMDLLDTMHPVLITAMGSHASNRAVPSKKS